MTFLIVVYIAADFVNKTASRLLRGRHGKSWDAARGKTGSGKKFFHNIIPGAALKTEPFYVSIIMPVIHYCMGGREIDVNSAVVSSKGKAIQGLYAAANWQVAFITTTSLVATRAGLSGFRPGRRSSVRQAHDGWETPGNFALQVVMRRR